ncbi:MAG: ABC transporter ATP-binding protein [Thermodesulfobacteriota bacterium]|jgi:peptide/nickel transport system ATP-binding protein
MLEIQDEKVCTFDTILKVSGVSVDLIRADEQRPILKNISFELNKGQVLGIIGESGSGKSVLSNTVANWIRPPLYITSGEVVFEGRNLINESEQKMSQIRGGKIGYIGSEGASSFDPTSPVGRQIVEKLRTVRPEIGAKEARERVLSLLAAVRIPEPEHRFNEYPFQYSGGMIQRAMIVDALIADPAFILADNITQPLDVTVASQIIFLLRDLKKKFNTTVIFISSSFPIVREIADEVMVLCQGEIVEKGTADELVSRPRHTYTKRLLARIPTIWNQEERVDQINAGNSQPPVLSISDVHKTFVVSRRDSFYGKDRVMAVRGASFNVMPGETFGLVGESGCGKSSISRLLARIDEFDQGAITFEGQEISKMNRKELLKFRSRFQLLLQDPHSSIPSHQSIGRIIAEPLLVHRRLSKSEVNKRVYASMEEVGLSRDLYNQLPTGLSNGECQRINIARALVLEPTFLILDETLSSLDHNEQMALLELFDRLKDEHGFTYLIITHDLALVRRVCTRIGVMYLGKIVELNDNHSVFFDPQHPYTKALLSAVPTVEEKPYRTEDVLMEGEPPSPINLPAGCSFANRCPSAFEPCWKIEPREYPTANGGITACYLHDPSLC